MHTCWAVSRFLRDGFSRVPILKGVSTVVSQPLGAGESGAMPSSTAWPRAVAARRMGANKAEARILDVVLGVWVDGCARRADPQVRVGESYLYYSLIVGDWWANVVGGWDKRAGAASRIMDLGEE